MISRTIYKAREQGEATIMQKYDYGVQDKYIKYSRKNEMHRYFRSIILKGVPSAFTETGDFVSSASRTKDFYAVDYISGEPIYKARATTVIEGEPLPVVHYAHCQHPFSQWVLESAGFVDKLAAKKAGLKNIMGSADGQHEAVQAYLMNNGLAEAVEVPCWVTMGDKELLGIDKLSLEKVYKEYAFTVTAFIDALIWWGGEWWIWDYKPQASQAKNRYAVSQLLTCRQLLECRTGLKNIKCAYSDEKDTYVLNV